MERIVAAVHPDTNGEGKLDSTGERRKLQEERKGLSEKGEGGSTHSHLILPDTRQDSNVAVMF